MIALDEIVQGYLDEWELADSHYRRVYGIAIRGLRFIHNNATGTARHATLEVLANKTAILPDDFLSKITLGVMNDLGEVYPLTEDENLGLKNSTEDERSGNPANITTSSRNQGVNIGVYRIDRENGLLILNPDFAYQNIELEYSSILGEGEDYKVHELMQETVNSFICWKDKRRSPQDRATGEREFYNFLRVGKRGLKPFDANEAILAYRNTLRIPSRG